MSSFKREERYIVIKRRHLTEGQEDALIGWLEDEQIQTTECVVVEPHWGHVYEQTWDAIQRYVEDKE